MTTEGSVTAGAGAPDHTDLYGPDALHLVDLFAPRGEVRGLVVLLHGGFWRSRWDRTHLRPLAAALAAAGHAVALPEYRRIGDPGGGWPGTGDDVLRMLETVPALAEARFGPGAVARVTLVGHSAGGHLAVWSQAGRGASVDRVVSLAGVLDLAAAHALGLSDDAVGELLGRDDVEGALPGADPMALPVPATEVVLLHGELDEEVPVSFSRAYAARSPRIRSLVLDDAGHYELIDPTSTAWLPLLSALAAEPARAASEPPAPAPTPPIAPAGGTA
ncbi:MAG: alpha/beta hydrolase [Herbiconiux sp.]|nr:alpha/beta hydrolase [Herbiconiux sp.]